MSAPISRARSMLEMILAALPVKSPTVGLICASAMRMVVMSICHFNRVNNPDDRRVNWPVFQPVCHARAAPRHDQHLLTKARADGVDSHKVAAFVLASERDRADEQKLFAFETRVFARRHYVADDASDDHSDGGVGSREWGVGEEEQSRFPSSPTPHSLLPTPISPLFPATQLERHGQVFVNRRVRARDDVYADQFANAARRRRARVSRGLDRSYLAAHYRGDETAADLLVTDQADVRRLDHCVRRLDHRHQPFCLNHSQSFHLLLAPFALLFSLGGSPTVREGALPHGRATAYFDNLISGDRARPVRAVRPLPDNFFIFAQLHAQDLPRQIRAARRGSLDYAFLFSRFHLPPPHALLPRDYR